VQSAHEAERWIAETAINNNSNSMSAVTLWVSHTVGQRGDWGADTAGMTRLRQSSLVTRFYGMGRGNRVEEGLG
jgi:hypothetical protein